MCAFRQYSARLPGAIPGHESTFRHFVVRLLATILAFALTTVLAQAEDLRGEVLATLRKATFEVVVEKPTTDSLSYEKELPFDLLPFRVRNDKYVSIGTAFALVGGQFVSAAHVVSLGSESVRRRIRLRDSDGQIIMLEQILKYSAAKDFVVFTVKDYQPSGHLPVSPTPAKNDKVFAVGNALGDGVIVRDGLYTSDTPEEEEGRWNWIRFSAAASPGNSGGPLVDRDGRVIGIVLRKSPNENLNFALPIGEALGASAREAEIQAKMIFKLDITDSTLQRTLNERIALPLGYVAFGEALQTLFNRFVESFSEQFKAAHRDDLFPASAGAQRLLYRTNLAASFPHVIAKQRDGTWAAVAPNETRETEIGKNGSLHFGRMGNYTYMRLKAPDGVTAQQMRTNSKRFMDLLLRGLYLTRAFGSERVRITSLGRAREESVYTDAYQRKWEVRRWMIEHSDERVVTYSLPMPGGYAILFNAADEAASHMYEIDMKTLTDFVFVTYYGTLRQWQDFLSLKDILPAAFDSIRIDPSYGKEFRYESRHLTFRYPDELMKVTENSDLHLKFSYFREHDRVVWDVTSVLFGEDKDTMESVSVSRHQRPPDALPDSDRRTWESLVNARMPFTGTAIIDKSRTIIGSAHRPPGTNGDLAKSPVLYSVVYVADGTQDESSMQRRLESFRAGIGITE